MKNPFILFSVLSSASGTASLHSAITVLILLIVLMGVIAVVLEFMRMRSRRASERHLLRMLTIPVYVVAAAVLVFTIYCGNRLNQSNDIQLGTPSNSNQSSSGDASSGSTSDPAGSSVPTQPSEPPAPSFPTAPHSTDKTDPAIWNVKWEIFKDTTLISSYQRPVSIHFSQPDTYFALPGIAGFRGNNYRNGGTYGSVNVVNKTLTPVWEREISALPKGSSGSWTGVGWTGQPLMVQWDEETKAIMNLYPSKKAKADLVEVIYATLDGHIYFYDLENGDYTRDPMYIGMTFKGSGALDPRGYPIMYVGSGDRTREGKQPRMFIINLIDCTIMYERGNNEEITLRRWCGFDASPVLDVETDTLIWPGENGLIYTIKLNTNYNKAAGTLTIAPDDPIINRYMSDLNSSDPQNTLGFENSPILVENYLYVGDNRGLYFCIDINTMSLVWAQCIGDDLNATPVFEWGDDNQGYLYIATSMEYAEGYTYLYKLNATTGEILWKKTFTDVAYDKDVSGGALSSTLLGQEGTPLEGIVFFHVARYPSYWRGTTVALDTATGEVIWEKETSYCWSSPLAIYSEDGKAYIILCDSAGNILLLDGLTGNTVTEVSLGSNIEASPAAFNDMLVVGTRGQKVFGVRIG